MTDEFIYNQIFRGALTKRYYFVRKAKRLGPGNYECSNGRKIDVTDAVEALLKFDRREQAAKRRKRARK